MRTAVIAGGIGLCLAGAAWLRSGPSRVLGVATGARMLAVSGGTLYWLGRTCSVWRTTLTGIPETTEPLEPVLLVSECPPDDPRVEGDVIYQPSSLGHVTRFSPTRRAVILERRMLYALALDARYLYAGNCSEADNCEIERLHAEDYPGDPTLMQAGIHHLTNMEVDEKEIFWVDLGRKKAICANEVIGDSDRVEYRCRDPVSPRLMAADKNQPRATERAVLTDFDGRRPLLGAHHVYWLGAGGVHRVPKAGGDNQLVLPTRQLSGFAADRSEVFFAADRGIFHARDGGPVELLQRTANAPRGVAIDGDFVYWIDADPDAPDRSAIFRRRR